MTSKSSAMRSGAVPLAACLFCFLAVQAFAGDCYIGKDCFGTVNPHMWERVCRLWVHEADFYSAGTASGESPSVSILPGTDLHPDRLHVEFLKLLTEKKFLFLRRGTRVFSCQYDLNLIKRDMDEARMKGIVLPRASCLGPVYSMVPVRPINMNTCYWVADVDVRCEEQVPYPTTPFDLFEEELKR